MIHKLKIEPNYIENLYLGKKKSEIRLNDRDYQVGDILEFLYQPEGMEGVYLDYLITHIHSGLGLKEGYVVLSLEQVK